MPLVIGILADIVTGLTLIPFTTESLQFVRSACPKTSALAHSADLS
jgi:hypothetical protein